MIDLRGKNAIVTGASSGIGAAIARQLAREKCNVFLTGLGASQLENTLQYCKRQGIAAYCKECDFSDFNTIDVLVEDIK